MHMIPNWVCRRMLCLEAVTIWIGRTILNLTLARLKDCRFLIFRNISILVLDKVALYQVELVVIGGSFWVHESCMRM